MLPGMARLQQLNPNTVRYRRFSERRKFGFAVLSIEVDVAETADMLVSAGQLDANMSDDRKAVAAALEKLIAALNAAERVRQ
jgi:hypothetical protein